MRTVARVYSVKIIMLAALLSAPEVCDTLAILLIEIKALTLDLKIWASTIHT